MKVKIKGIEIEFDESLDYYDYTINGGLIIVDFSDILALTKRYISGKGKKHLKQVERSLIRLTRWVTEAPRKRRMRELSQTNGIFIMTEENLFKGKDGNKTLIGLENTGKFARQLLRELYNNNKVMIWMGHDIRGNYRIVKDDFL